MLEKVKLLIYGLDTKANKRNNIYDAIIYFTVDSYLDREINDVYVSTFKSNAKIVILVGGKNIFYSEDLVDTQGPDGKLTVNCA